MSKRYMDFAPRKATVKGAPVKKATLPAKAVPARRATLTRKATPKAVERILPAKQVNFGVIEDLGAVDSGTEVVEKPVENLVGKTTSTPVRSDKKVVASKSASNAMATMAIPHSPFINQNKVEKRPLSKNVYTKRVVPTEEKAAGPVTIISKPEKDKHVGIIVTIIITIILGAAAGTVAFLLLPK